MDGRRFQAIEGKRDGFFSNPEMGFQLNFQECGFSPGGLFASVGQVGVGFGLTPNPPNPRDNGGKVPGSDLYANYAPAPELGVRILGGPREAVVEGVEEVEMKKGSMGGVKLRVKIKNPSLRRLISGAIAGAVSRTAVAPLETIRTHLMVGSNGHSTTEVFHNIMKTEGWTGLFRGNFVNVIRVAPSKAVEVVPFTNFNLFEMRIKVAKFFISVNRLPENGLVSLLRRFANDDDAAGFLFGSHVSN
ncbi:hypothetical protein ACLOJK_031991 [Asimina triloba]